MNTLNKPPIKTAPPRGYRIVKRLLDLVLSALLLALAALPLLLIAALIRLESPGPALFRQTRIGRNERPFTCYKFRTMRSRAPDHKAKKQLEHPEDYITPLGKLLRKTSIDELPQLINVLRGDMSLIGPRPLIPEETDVHTLRAAAGVYALRPGLTGLAQIRGRDTVSAEEKAALDADYLHSVSLKTDVGIFIESISYVLLAKDVHEGKSE